MNPRVKSVIAGDDYTLEVTFSNGEVGLYDCAPLLPEIDITVVAEPRAPAGDPRIRMGPLLSLMVGHRHG